MSYQQFIKQKHSVFSHAGFACDNSIPGGLYDWQQRIVKWCCHKGRAAIFADCGLGKTAMQLAWCDQVVRNTEGKVLILTPIAVAPQTVRESMKFGVPGVRIASDQSEVADPGIYVTNYDRLHKFDASEFAGVCLDESSILKSFTGKIKSQLCEDFSRTPYRLACTATAAPNDHMELGNHSEFLGVMDRDIMLSRFFTHDSGDTSKWRLKRHGEKDFWRWVASWAVCVSSPSDVGGSDDGYTLPTLKINTRIIEDSTAPAGHLFKPEVRAISATNIHGVKRAGVAAKADLVADIVNQSDEFFTIWCDTNYEADALKSAIDDVVEVRGSTKNKAEILTGFTEGKYRRLITKPEIGGFGLNWHHCYNTAYFAGFSFERWYQSIRRHYRFGQKNEVNVHLVATEDEAPVIEALERKARIHNAMQREMAYAMQDGMQEELFGQPVRSHVPSVSMVLPQWLERM